MMINDLLPKSLSSPGSDLPEMSRELQEEGQGAQGVGDTHPPPTPSPKLLHVLSHSQPSRSNRKPPVNTQQGPQSLSEEGTQHGGGSQGAVSSSISFGSLGVTLVGCPVPTKACPFLLRHPALPRRPFKFGPLSTVPVAGRPKAGLHGPGGTGLALWGGLLGGFVASCPNSGAAGREQGSHSGSKAGAAPRR